MQSIHSLAPFPCREKNSHGCVKGLYNNSKHRIGKRQTSKQNVRGSLIRRLVFTATIIKAFSNMLKGQVAKAIAAATIRKT